MGGRIHRRRRTKDRSAEGGAADPLDDGLGPDEQVEAELADLGARLDQFVAQRQSSLQARHDFLKTLMGDVSVAMRAFFKRQRQVARVQLEAWAKNPPRRESGRPPKPRPARTILGSGLPRPGPRPSRDMSKVFRDVFDRRLAAEGEGRLLRRGGALCEVLAEDLKKTSPTKYARLKYLQDGVGRRSVASAWRSAPAAARRALGAGREGHRRGDRRHGSGDRRGGPSDER